jgi:hypothetical protein
MPKRPSQGVKNVNVELPPDLIEAVRALAEKNGRPFREEVVSALRRHLEAPPTVEVVETRPPLPAATVTRQGAGRSRASRRRG